MVSSGFGSLQNGGVWNSTRIEGRGSIAVINNATWTKGFVFLIVGPNSFTTAAGAVSSFDDELFLNGTMTLVNHGTMNLDHNMAALRGSSSLYNAAGASFQLTGNANSAFTNNGTVVNNGAIAVTGNFTNNDTITGPLALPAGTITATSYTVNTGSFGADGSYLSFCDSTPPMPTSDGFDSAAGTIGANVTFCDLPLPVTLISFTAQLRQGQVLAQWATALEINNQEFVVERSADGTRFATVQVVAGHGTTA